MTMARIKLTLAAKLFIAVVIVVVLGVTFRLNPQLWQMVAPEGEQKKGSNVPPTANLPDQPDVPAVAVKPPGCAKLPEVRLFHWAWNAQMGLMYAVGGKQAVADSLMCKNKVNLKLTREDNGDNMQAALVAFAEELKSGKANPEKGTHFVVIMGDGAPAFLKGLNDKLTKLGPEYIAQVVGVLGYSRGEDKFMGPAAWKQNPQAARGGLVSGVLRDGDWNIALKWLGDNKIPNNPDETTFDPDALNWVNANDYIEAAQKYVSGFCTDLKNTKTGNKEKHCVNGVVTWTPGDVTVAEKKGGLVSIVSTKEYRSQMPAVLIGIKKWMGANRETVDNLLYAALDGGDEVKKADEALKQAAGVSALTYNEKDGAYWYKYFKPQVQTDKTGVAVELGGSSVNNLPDALNSFGLLPGSTNLFAATYTVFGNVVKSQYPNLVPTFYPAEQISDVSFLKDIAKRENAGTQADLPTFAGGNITQVVSKRSWEIEFATGSDKFSPKASDELKKLFNDLVVAGGTLVEIHGHTDNQGSADHNQKLSEDRAFAVKKWLESQSAANFPDGRMKVFAHGMTQPIAPNATAEGRARNRRVEIVMGTGG
jgi:outer membrane protein OmpA-like peptidoglycan-associated protein